MVRPSRRGGVPVFRRPTGSVSSRSRAPARLAGGSPARPASIILQPDMDQAREEGARGEHDGAARKRRPICVTTPVTRSPSSSRSSTACWNSVRLGWFSRRWRMAPLVEHAVGLGARGAHRRPLATN